MWYWWLGSCVAFAASIGCIVSTMVEMKQGKSGPNGPKAGEFWGGIAFHGVTAVVAFWLLTKAIFH